MAKQQKTQFENNRQLILETASKLFTEKGIVSTSFSDISKETKLSKGTIYYYYPSKDHLIYETTEFHFKLVSSNIFAWISSLESDVPINKAISMLLNSLFETTSFCKLHICFAYEGIMGNETLKKRFLEKYNEWNTMIEVGLVKTGLDSTKIKHIAKAVSIVMDGMILKRALDIVPDDLETTCNSIIDNIV